MERLKAAANLIFRVSKILARLTGELVGLLLLICLAAFFLSMLQASPADLFLLSLVYVLIRRELARHSEEEIDFIYEIELFGCLLFILIMGLSLANFIGAS